MIDRNKLTQARTWSARVNRDSIDMTHRFNENTLAAAEIINKLPNEIVDGEDIRELIENYEEHNKRLGITPSDIARRKVNRSLISDLRALLPQPTLMSEIEWDDSKHHLAEIEVVGSKDRLIMLAPEADDDGKYTGIIYCANEIGETEGWYAHVLKLTGQRFHLVPADWKPSPEPESSPTKPEDFDPAYTYSDKDGDKWEFSTVEKAWVCYYHATGDIQMIRPRPLAEYGPYTRIEA